MEAKTLVVTDKIFDLKAFETVEVGKEIPFTPVSSVEEATARLGNDTAKLLGAINKGLESEAKKAAKNDPSGWRTFNDAGELNGPFAGIAGDEKKVSQLRLTMAKTNHNFNTDMTREQKQAAKAAADNDIKQMLEIGILKAEAFAPQPDAD